MPTSMQRWRSLEDRVANLRKINRAFLTTHIPSLTDAVGGEGEGVTDVVGGEGEGVTGAVGGGVRVAAAGGVTDVVGGEGEGVTGAVGGGVRVAAGGGVTDVVGGRDVTNSIKEYQWSFLD